MEHRETRRQILGFDCFHLEVREKRTIQGRGKFENRLDLFVTDQIVLPGHHVVGLYAPRLPYCVLQGVIVDAAQPNNATRLIATSLSNDLDPRMHEVPERLKQE